MEAPDANNLRERAHDSRFGDGPRLGGAPRGGVPLVLAARFSPRFAFVVRGNDLRERLSALALLEVQQLSVRQPQQLVHRFDADLRVRALAAFAQSDTAEHLAAANKRVANILTKAESIDGVTSPDPKLFVEAAESALYEAIMSSGDNLAPLLAERNYQSALDQLAQLRGPVDAFFDTVMVNAENPAERSNRLRLLGELRALFTQVADLALLSSAAE